MPRGASRRTELATAVTGLLPVRAARRAAAGTHPRRSAPRAPTLVRGAADGPDSAGPGAPRGHRTRGDLRALRDCPAAVAISSAGVRRTGCDRRRARAPDRRALRRPRSGGWPAARSRPGRPERIPRREARCSGSSPVVGSSRTTSSGVPMQRLRDGEPAPLPTGQGADPPRAAVCRGRRGPGLVGPPGGAAGVTPFLEHRDVVEEPEGRHAARKPDLLRQVADPAPRPRTVGRRACDVETGDDDAAGARSHGRRQQADHRGLAGSVRAEQPDDAVVEPEVGGRQRVGRPVRPADALEHGDGWRLCHDCPLRTGGRGSAGRALR